VPFGIRYQLTDHLAPRFNTRNVRTMFDFSMCLGGRRVGETHKLFTYAFWLACGEKINARTQARAYKRV
jgi:hypothetical protein